MPKPASSRIINHAKRQPGEPMPPITPSRALPKLLIPSPDGSPLRTGSAGTPPGSEGGQGMNAPPPGEARMEALFEAVGMSLMLAIVVAAAWILIRHRR
jgi:hypothetical protein